MTTTKNLKEYKRIAATFRSLLGDRKNDLIISISEDGIELYHNTKRPTYEHSNNTFFYAQEVVDFCRTFRLSSYVTCGYENDVLTAKMRIYGYFDLNKKD